VVVDQGVDVVVAESGLGDPGAVVELGLTQRTPSTAVGDPAELLDVHVDQFPGTVAFVPVRGGP